jgi:hypothetical protein
VTATNIDFTTLVAIDKEHREELFVAMPGWVKRPAIAEHPIVILYDELQLSVYDVKNVLAGPASSARIVPVSEVLPARIQQRGITQRERMLSAITYASGRRDIIQSPKVLKLDTDTAATDQLHCFTEAWIEGDPVIAAPRWGYTKPGHWIDSLDCWAAIACPSGGRPERTMAGQIAKSKRIISYAMLGDVSFIAEALRLAGDRLPVPSQDTFLWYVAEMLGRRVNRLRPPDVPWRHFGGNLNRMRREIA